MRRIGNLTDQAIAQRFCDYLTTLSIDATADERVEDASDGEVPKTWDIWIREESDVERARAELAEFEADPGDSRYQASAEAARIRQQRAADNARRMKNVVKRQKWSDSGASGRTMLAGAPVKQQGIPVTIGIIVISTICGFAANFSRRPASPMEQRIRDAMDFVEDSDYNASGRTDAFASLRKGELWRVVTPMFMHGDTMHLAFNMLMIYFLGSIIERLHGSLFLAVIALVTHVAGMALQVMLPGADAMPWFLERLAGTPKVIGASGAVCGLFGFLWIRPYVDESYPVRMMPINIAMILGFIVFAMLPIFDLRVANGAHLGGLIAGMAIAPLLPAGRSP